MAEPIASETLFTREELNDTIASQQWKIEVLHDALVRAERSQDCVEPLLGDIRSALAKYDEITGGAS